MVHSTEHGKFILQFIPCQLCCVSFRSARWSLKLFIKILIYSCPPRAYHANAFSFSFSLFASILLWKNIVVLLFHVLLWSSECLQETCVAGKLLHWKHKEVSVWQLPLQLLRSSLQESHLAWLGLSAIWRVIGLKFLSVKDKTCFLILFARNPTYAGKNQTKTKHAKESKAPAPNCSNNFQLLHTPMSLEHPF